MKTLNNDEAVQWITSTGVHAYHEFVEECPHASGEKYKRSVKGLLFQSEQLFRIRVPLPEQPYRIVILASYLLPYLEAQFQPCILWFTDWGMWNDHHERVGYRLMNLLRAAHGESRPLIETPAHVFDSSEVVDAQTLLATAILMSWDVYLVPMDGKFLVFNSHDEYVDVESTDRATHEALFRDLKDWGAKEVLAG